MSDKIIKDAAYAASFSTIIKYIPYLHLRIICKILGHKIFNATNILKDEFTRKFFPELINITPIIFCERCHIKLDENHANNSRNNGII